MVDRGWRRLVVCMICCVLGLYVCTCALSCYVDVDTVSWCRVVEQRKM